MFLVCFSAAMASSRSSYGCSCVLVMCVCVFLTLFVSVAVAVPGSGKISLDSGRLCAALYYAIIFGYMTSSLCRVSLLY